MSFMDTMRRFEQDRLVHPPKWLLDNTIYLTQMGSVAYGVSGQSSDIDVYGMCVPPKDVVFPESCGGEIPGFGRQIQKFEQFQQHHVIDAASNTHDTSLDPNEYDFSIYNIVKYFQLLMDNNPNMLDSIYTPDRCVLYINEIGKHVRANRDMFLHKGSMHKLRGYAYSQMSKIKSKANAQNPKRQASIDEFGYDVKFAYHLVRLMLEAEQIAQEHTLDIERNSNVLKSIRRGEWSIEQLENWFETKNNALETVYANSSLRNKPDENEIKKVLIECLEMHFGNLSNLKAAKSVDNSTILADLKSLIKKYE